MCEFFYPNFYYSQINVYVMLYRALYLLYCVAFYNNCYIIFAL